MKHAYRILLPLLCLVWAAVAGAQNRMAPRELDRVVAVVNSDVITGSELAARMRTIQKQLAQRRIDAPAPDVLEKQVLERLIMDRALTQLAREQGVRVDDATLERAVSGIATENRMTVAQLRQQVESDGSSFQQFRNEVRDEVLVARLREREVDSRIQISEADIDAFIAEHRNVGQAEQELELAQILLRVPEGASPEQIERQRLRGEEVLRQLQAGAEFSRLSAAFSDAPEAMSGGSLGMRSTDRLPQLFVDAVAGLEAGGVSKLLRSPNGFHVLKLVTRRNAGAPQIDGTPITQTHVRHILIRPSELVSEPQALRRLEEIRQRIEQEGADFAELARQYSVDGSAGRGGDLGWIYPGDTVPAFERAMNALAPAQISAPVRTEFGFHLIQVLERRTDAASPERVRAKARQALRERRSEEAFQDWLRQVRDRTYVEYRDR